MKKIIIYGLGNERIKLENSINVEKYEIIGYTDSFANITVFNNKPFINKVKLKEIYFDYIVISVKNSNSWPIIKKDLEQIGISPNKILIYYDYIKAERIMETCTSPYEGVILGMSYAEVGVLPSMLPFKCCNLAISSQDIFYNYKTLEYCYSNYKSNFNLRYLLIDIYDYRWFNLDLSMGINIYPYICSWHGYDKDLHNLSKNDRISLKQKEEIIIKHKNGKEKNNIWSELLNREWDGAVLPVDRDKIIDNRTYNIHDINKAHFKTNIYNNTFKKNKTYFQMLLDLAKTMNPDVKIVFLILPRYIQVERILDLYNHYWKKEFYVIINKLMSEYNNLEILDLRKSTEISSNYRFFYDLEHLNYTGAVALTSYINKSLQSMYKGK